ncbi:hypothetical protein LUX73_35415 [Actinomadura madurae]|nr:hypothetical protein [Actinomadura madurae]MCQ0009486.1 hypothetical protein [Actinomadura madurae]
MHADLRVVEPGGESAGAAHDLLAQAVGVDEFAGADPDLVQAVQEVQRGQFPGRERQHVDPHAELTDLLAALVDHAADAFGVQAQGGEQPADPRSHNRDVHGCLPHPERVQVADPVCRYV